jgi:MoaA/NifB/PqqE/SkfB family radical SAM enzyme
LSLGAWRDIFKYRVGVEMTDQVPDCQLNVYNFATLQAGAPTKYVALRFDPNNTCNLHCVYCHNHRSNEVIDTAAFSRFVEEKVIGVEMFQFGCAMEPTLDKRLSDLMLIVSRSPARPTVDLMLQTNGTLLHRHDHGKMVEAGLTRLSVSMDAAEPETQKALRDGTSLTKVTRNVFAFIAACPHTSVEFITTVTTANIDKLESLVALGLDLGVRRFVFRELFYYPDSNVVDHARMPALLLRVGQFTALEERLRTRFTGGVEMIFVANERLDSEAREMAKNSRFVGRDIGVPMLHTANLDEESRPQSAPFQFGNG